MSEERKLFDCQRCGRCCRDLLSKDAGVLRGLTLLPEEKGLFKWDIITPAMGKGKDPKEPSFKILAYQLTEDKCPYFKEKLCMRYSDRPASCRQFPFSLRKGQDGRIQMGLDLNCPAIKDAIKKGIRPAPNSEIISEAKKLLRLELIASRKLERTWYYDLSKGRWIRYDWLSSVK